jgi:hypothetical protein
MNHSNQCDKDKRQESVMHDLRLVRTSLLLAVLLEVIPLEGDILDHIIHSTAKGEGILLLVVLKAIFLAIILSPLIVYVVRNGLRSLALAKGQVAIVSIIVGINFAMFCCMVWAKLTGRW